jgi:hypothetical protein
MNTHPSQQRRTTCRRGHPMSGDNLLEYADKRPNGAPRVRRRCRECQRIDWHERRKHLRGGS